MAHPYSTFPDICKEDTGNFDTPTTAIQEDGWPDSSVPAAKHFNWFGHWTSKWVNYLAGLVPDTLATSLAQILTNQTNIATNTADIATNTADIATNVADIATNTADIATNTAQLATNTPAIATNAANIATNVANIASNSSAISGLGSAGVNPAWYNPTDVYLTTDDGGVSPEQIDISFTAFNGLVHVTWETKQLIMDSANSTYIMYLAKTTSNWEDFVVDDQSSYQTRVPIVVLVNNEMCAGMMSLPRTADYTNSGSHMVLYISKPATILSETYEKYYTNYFRGTAGLVQGTAIYKTTIVTP